MFKKIKKYSSLRKQIENFVSFYIKILVLFKGFVQVTVTDSYAGHQDFVSTFPLVF